VLLLDMLGYHAANVTDYLPPSGRARLRDHYLNIAPVDADHPYIADGIAYADAPPPAHPHTLHIALETAPHVAVSEMPTLHTIYTVTLQTLAAGQIGVATIHYAATTRPTITAFEVVTVREDTPADPTVNGMLDLIGEELRYKLRRQRGTG
jgi:hypothetical protein